MYLMLMQGGELIFSCKDASDPQADLSALALQLRPYFSHSASLYKGHLSAKTVLNEFIQVVTSALLSSWNCSRTGEPKKVHPAEGRGYCEASPAHRDLLRNGEPIEVTILKVLAVMIIINTLCEGIMGVGVVLQCCQTLIN